MKIDGAIFDLDGTLLDSLSVWETLGEQYLYAKGVTAEKELNSVISDMNITQSAKYFKEYYSISDSEDKIIRDINELIKDFYFNKAGLIEGAFKFLKFLSEKNIKMVVATTTDVLFAKAALKRLGILDLFVDVLSCNTGEGKDRPDIYLKAKDVLDCENIWVFEDAYYAAKTAKTAGFPVCGVFSRYEKNPKEMNEICDVYIENLKEAVKYFD